MAMESGSVKELLDRMMNDTDQSSGSGGTRSNDAVASSDSLAQLQAGYKRTLAHATMLKERFEAKTKDAPSKYVCVGCLASFKRKGNLERHWKSSKNECSEASRFQLVKDVQITAEDRMTPENIELGEKIRAARDAAQQVAQSLNQNKSTSREGAMDAARLMRFPIGGFEQILRKTSVEELQKFIQMRFDRMTAPKKVMAIKELQSRNMQLAIS